jgi:hypothetical protein
LSRGDREHAYMHRYVGLAAQIAYKMIELRI